MRGNKNTKATNSSLLKKGSESGSSSMESQSSLISRTSKQTALLDLKTHI
jgi:hypothetical protein